MVLGSTFFLRVYDRLQSPSEMLDPLDVFPLNPIVNKSHNIECCGNKMTQIVANMIVS